MSRDFVSELAELRRVYVTSLPGKLDEIAAALRERSLTDAHALSHRLRGTAGSYGLPTVGTAIGAIEDCIDAAAGESPALWDELDHLLLAARTAIQELL